MIKDLNNYILRIENFIPNNLCDKIIKNLEDTKFETHTFYNARTNIHKPLSGEQELEVTFDNIDGKDELGKSFWYAIQKYIQHIDMPWFDSWSGYTNLKINKYVENRKMHLHCDHIHSAFDGKIRGVPILSVLGFLNDDFEGGEFIMFDNEKFKFKKGEVVIFPSNFLYPHKVNPVTKGTRYSVVSWVY